MNRDLAAEARRIRLTNTAVFMDGCFQSKVYPPCALCQAVERGIAAGLVAAGWLKDYEAALAIVLRIPDDDDPAMVALRDDVSATLNGRTE